MRHRRSSRHLFALVPTFGLALLLLANRAEASSAQPVTIGCYLQNLPEIDVKSNSFAAEFYLWFLWKGDIDPTQSFQLTNAVSLGDLTKTAVFTDDEGQPKAEALEDGRSYQVFHVQGRFGHPFPLAKFPFDDHEIVISIEDVKHPLAELVTLIDTGAEHAARPGDPGVEPGADAPRAPPGPLRHQLRRSPRHRRQGDLLARGLRGPRQAAGRGHPQQDGHPAGGDHHPITLGAFFLRPEDIDARLVLTITALIPAGGAAVHRRHRAAADRLHRPPRQDLHPQLRGDPAGDGAVHRRQPPGEPGADRGRAAAGSDWPGGARAWATSASWPSS